MPKALSYALKIIWYVLRWAVIIAAVIGLFALAFYTAMDMANVYIITTDGLKKRADVVMASESAQELIEYFTEDMLEKDALLYSLQYQNYTIKSYEHKVRVEWINVRPWKDEAVVTVSESMPVIDGVLNLDQQQEGMSEAELAPPDWEAYRYDVHLARDEDGRFYITELEKLARVEEESATPAPTLGPDRTLTPRPTPTPTLAPSPTP